MFISQLLGLHFYCCDINRKRYTCQNRVTRELNAKYGEVLSAKQSLQKEVMELQPPWTMKGTVRDRCLPVIRTVRTNLITMSEKKKAEEKEKELTMEIQKVKDTVIRLEKSKSHVELELDTYKRKLDTEINSHKETIQRFNADKKRHLVSKEEARTSAINGGFVAQHRG
uniref:Uncharacterized protein n=1 Tax=Magallana gigas TaxID=29159 RepID=A0A8W8IQK1_MAGGI